MLHLDIYLFKYFIIQGYVTYIFEGLPLKYHGYQIYLPAVYYAEHA